MADHEAAPRQDLRHDDVDITINIHAEFHELLGSKRREHPSRYNEAGMHMFRQIFAQALGQRGSDQAGRSGDGDVHGVLLVEVWGASLARRR